MLPAADRLLEYTTRAFDWLETRWEGARGQRALGNLLVVIFLGGLALIELNRRGWLPDGVSRSLPTSHFAAVAYAFTALLAMELVGLVLALAHSVAESLGKQFEVFALILLRKAFLEYAHFPEPLEWTQVAQAIPHVLADMAGALVIFTLLGLYYRVQRHQAITQQAADQAQFVRAKKAIAVVLLVVLVGSAASAIWSRSTVDAAHFFATFYTALVFSDILLVLVAMRTSSQFRVVFRNSGFAAATTIIRLALSAPAFVNAGLGVGAMAFALLLSVAYNAFGKQAGAGAGATS